MGRSSPSRVRFAAPNNGAPLTAPGRSQERFLTREKGSVLMAAGTVGANAARMGPFFAATVTGATRARRHAHWPPSAAATAGPSPMGHPRRWL
jgi:hypothetical protein